MEGDIRLVGGKAVWEGDVQIFFCGSWKSVAYGGYRHYYFTSQVVCRQLGYSLYSKSNSRCACRLTVCMLDCCAMVQL